MTLSMSHKNILFISNYQLKIVVNLNNRISVNFSGKQPNIMANQIVSTNLISGCADYKMPPKLIQR